MNRRHRIIIKILARIKRVPPPDHIEGDCWIWQGSHSGEGRGGGYPRMSLDGHTVAVHRVVYDWFFGYIPGKKQIDHKCKRRMCVNPDHLEMVTHKENQKRKYKDVRK